MRLIVFMVSFIFTSHFCACFWIICAVVSYDPIVNGFEFTFAGTWLKSLSPTDSPAKIYTHALYWTVQTVTTVGYGDISINNMLERFFCCIVMLIGVIAYGFAIGSLTSIMSNYDNTSGPHQ